jgi:S-adenosylmethionine synthetase
MIRNGLFASDANRDDEAIAAALLKAFDLRPGAIIERLDLKKPSYFDTAR